MCLGEDEILTKITIDTNKSLTVLGDVGVASLAADPLLQFSESVHVCVQEMKANPETEIREEPEPAFSGDDVVLVKGKHNGFCWTYPKVGKVEVAIPF